MLYNRASIGREDSPVMMVIRCLIASLAGVAYTMVALSWTNGSDGGVVWSDHATLLLSSAAMAASVALLIFGLRSLLSVELTDVDQAEFDERGSHR